MFARQQCTLFVADNRRIRRRESRPAAPRSAFARAGKIRGKIVQFSFTDFSGRDFACD